MNLKALIFLLAWGPPLPLLSNRRTDLKLKRHRG